MSVTTTANTVTGSVLHLLTDYDLHHSGDPAHAGTPTSPNDHPVPGTQHGNPDNWPRNYQGIPDYRPINYNLDPDERPAGSNPIEMVFIYTMLNGVRLNAVCSQVYKWKMIVLTNLFSL